MARTADATLKIEGSAPVFGDQNRLKQVFENLFRNAADHAGDDVTVWVVRLSATGQPRETVRTSEARAE